MPPAPVPPDDDARVAALLRFGVLDAPADPHLDGLTELAAVVAEAPVAVISRIERTRCVQASTYGAARGTGPRVDSMCDHVVSEGRTISVSDARATTGSPTTPTSTAGGPPSGCTAVRPSSRRTATSSGRCASSTSSRGS